jgi:serine phosphatase RsbU (regulator of sigma subunit)
MVRCSSPLRITSHQTSPARSNDREQRSGQTACRCRGDHHRGVRERALTAAERSQLVLNTQLALAAQVQHRLLPALPDAGHNVRWAARLQPAGKIGGDFCDFILTPGGGMLLVGDVSGKGIPAALLQASAHALFRTFSRQASQPAELLCLVSREVFAENSSTALVDTSRMSKCRSTSRQGRTEHHEM